jgi:hypothetical protein
MQARNLRGKGRQLRATPVSESASLFDADCRGGTRINQKHIMAIGFIRVDPC